MRRLLQGSQAQNTFNSGDSVVETRFAEPSQGWPNSFETHPYDFIGRDVYMSDQERAEHVGAMVEAGYADRVLLSSDLVGKAALKRYEGRGYADVLRRFVPLLEGAGLGEATIRGGS